MVFGLSLLKERTLRFNMNFLPSIFACATCLPDQNTEVAKAANLAIFFMVGVVVLVLGVVLKIMFNFARKQRQFSDNNS